MTPVFFGSALNNFGVRELLRRHRRAGAAAAAAAGAAARRSSRRATEVTGFVFKVQANIDPQHRDRVAFLRLVLGPLPARHEIEARPQRPADERAEPGVLPGARAQPRRGGLARRHHRHSQSRHAAHRRHADRGRGDPRHRHPELRARDPAPRAARRPDEVEASEARAGAARRGRRDPRLQAADRRRLDRRRRRRAAARRAGRAAQDRIRARRPPRAARPTETARWVEADDPAEIKRFRASNPSAIAEDHDGVPVFLARNAWDLRTTIKEWPKIRFKETREQS